MRKYILSAQNTVLPMATSFFVIPFLIKLAGIEGWQSITIGQGVGLLLAEIVQGSWKQVAPKIGLDHSFKVDFLYSSSLRERRNRFFVCAISGASILPLVCEKHLLLAEISFLIWLMNGLNAHWITIGTGNGKLTLKFFTLPRVIATIVGMAVAFSVNNISVYLAFQFFTTVASIYSLTIFTGVEKSIETLKQYVNSKQILISTMNNVLEAGNSWILLLMVNLLFQSGDLEFSILIRYSEFAFALMTIIPQMNHSQFLSRKTEGRKLISINIFQTFAIFILFTILFPIVDKYIFGNQSQSGYLICSGFLSISVLRLLILLFAQDFLIPQKRFSDVSKLQTLVACSFLVNSLLVKITHVNLEILPLLVSCTIMVGCLAYLFNKRQSLCNFGQFKYD